MAHLRVYTGGTPGLADGTEIEPGTNYIDASGLYPYTELVIPICLRCDPGFNATGVTITKGSNTSLQTYPFFMTTFSTLSAYQNFNSSGAMSLQLSFSTIGNSNIMFLLCLVTQSITGNPAPDIVDLFSISFTEVIV